MIDSFTIFQRGGSVLWTRNLVTLKGSPVNTLVQKVLLEERSGQTSFDYEDYRMSWTFANELDLVFVAVYLNLSKLLYVDEMLQAVKNEFCKLYRTDAQLRNFSEFDTKYDKILTKMELKAGIGVKRDKPRNFAQSRKSKPAAAVAGESTSGGGGGGGGDDEEDGPTGNAKSSVDPLADMEKLAKLRALRKVGRRPAPFKKKTKNKGAAEAAEDKKKSARKKRANRKWADSALSNQEAEALNKSGAQYDAAAAEADRELASEQFGSAPVAGEAWSSDEESEEDEADAAPKSGLFNMFAKLTGNKVLEREDIQQALDNLKDGLMGKNVAADIADKLCESVAASVVGKKLPSFTTIHQTVKKAMETALTRILTPKKNIDVLQGIQSAREQNRPYSIVFVGVNGVGKSTSLAKLAAYFMSKSLSVGIAACDTFRSGAIEQLRTHSRALGVPVYESGYNRDASSVAAHGISQATKEGKDVILVDTAGRMQDNDPLMRALSKLINLNKPDLVLFVGEALVGNDAVDQLSKFNRALADLSDQPVPRLIDGIVLTKFDTIDDKVGAAISMTYTTGKPIMFVGVGQTYRDLKRMNVKMLIKALL